MNTAELIEMNALNERVKKDGERLSFLERRWRYWREERRKLRNLWRMRHAIQSFATNRDAIEAIIETAQQAAAVSMNDSYYDERSQTFEDKIGSIKIGGCEGLCESICFEWRNHKIIFTWDGVVRVNKKQIHPVVTPEPDWYAYQNGV